MCTLSSKLEPAAHDSPVIEARLEKILGKVHDMDGIVNEIVTDLEAQIKDKEAALKKMKKNYKVSE